MNCIFCKIINNDIPSYTIYEENDLKIFLDVNPLNDGHLLIIPKKHYQDVCDIPLNIQTKINRATKKMYVLLEQRLKFDGLKIIQNNGSAQEIKHFHVHLIPIYKKNTKRNVKEIYDILKK